jgi:hypothetical protein
MNDPTPGAPSAGSPSSTSIADGALTQKDLLDAKIDIWKKIVDVQMHFNELEMKIRNFAVLLLSAFIGAAGLALKEDIRLAPWNMPLATAILAAASMIVLLFYFVDRFWYHPLLKGSVVAGIDIEADIEQAHQIPGISLTKTIGKHSAVKLPFTKAVLRSDRKVSLFYICTFAIFLGLAVAIFFAHSVPATSHSSPDAGTTGSVISLRIAR